MWKRRKNEEINEDPGEAGILATAELHRFPSPVLSRRIKCLRWATDDMDVRLRGVKKTGDRDVGCGSAIGIG